MRMLSEYGGSVTRDTVIELLSTPSSMGPAHLHLRTIKQDGLEEDRDRRRAGTSKHLDATT